MGVNMVHNWNFESTLGEDVSYLLNICQATFEWQKDIRPFKKFNLRYDKI